MHEVSIITKSFRLCNSPINTSNIKPVFEIKLYAPNTVIMTHPKYQCAETQNGSWHAIQVHVSYYALHDNINMK